MHLEQLLSSTTSESIDESLHTVMVALETNAGAVETTRGTSGSLRERWTGRKLSTEAFTREEIIGIPTVTRLYIGAVGPV